MCVFFVQVVVVEGRSIMCSDVFHDVFMFEESQNSLMLESLNLKRQGEQDENGRECIMGRVPAKRHFLMFQKPAIFINILYFLQVAKMYILFVGRVNVEETWKKATPFFGRRTMLQKMPS